MGFSVNNNISAVSGARQARSARTATAAGRQENAARRFDSVSIGGVRSGSGNFVMALRSKLNQEVRAAATPGRLSALRQQVQDGTYQPDPRAIARTMLLIAEEA